MRKPLLLFFLLLSELCFAQNLVPNPSFEDTLGCPTMGGQINLATGWENWGITPDYFNSCNTSGFIGTPTNGWGYQVPIEGNAYAGLFCNMSTVPNVREFTGCQLSQTLVIGQNYYASLYVSLSDIPSGTCAINKLGIKFSTIPFSSSTPPPLTNSAHIFTNVIVSDSTSWTRISGWFTADSTYNYVMLGIFFDQANIDTLNCPTQTGTASYYFFDMICVSSDSADCFIENPNQVYDVSSHSNAFKVFPQPAHETLNFISTSSEIENIEIYSVVGKLIYSKSFNGINRVLIPVSDITNGIYLTKITMNKKTVIQKVQIIH